MTEYILTTLGGIGSVASIVALFKSTKERRLVLIHAAYMASLACVMTGYLLIRVEHHRSVEQANAELKELLSPERQAAELLKDADFRYSDQGFMLTTLTFFEKHKDKFPDTYRRAEEVCKVNGLLESRVDGGLRAAWKHIDGKSAMKSLLEGVSAGTLRQ